MDPIEKRANDNIIVLSGYLILHIIVLFLPSLLFGICFPLMFIADMSLVHYLFEEADRRFENPKFTNVIRGCNVFRHYPSARQRIIDAVLETLSPELITVDEDEPSSSSTEEESLPTKTTSREHED